MTRCDSQHEMHNTFQTAARSLETTTPTNLITQLTQYHSPAITHYHSLSLTHSTEPSFAVCSASHTPTPPNKPQAHLVRHFELNHHKVGQRDHTHTITHSLYLLNILNQPLPMNPKRTSSVISNLTIIKFRQPFHTQTFTHSLYLLNLLNQRSQRALYNTRHGTQHSSDTRQIPHAPRSTLRTQPSQSRTA